MAVVAVGVLVLALVIRGNRTGAIVAQTVTEWLGGAAPTNARHGVSLTVIAETDASGDLRRLFSTSSLGRRQESLSDGQKLEAYLPQDNTIYVMTQRTLMLAEDRSFHQLAAGRQRTVTFWYDGTWLAPGRTSFFAMQLRRHNYRIAGRTTIDGRAAIKLVPLRSMIPLGSGRPQEQMLLQTAYVSPGTYDPIEESKPGFGTTVWRHYRVLADTAANQRLLSLKDRHPAARMSHSASAYLHAVQTQLRQS